jgi:7-carboxy-7-deazaguanine synthase
MALKVNEIFYSIQGESSYAGRPCVFVRLTGCNLRCLYCDTKYAYEEGKEVEIDHIVDLVRSHECPLVEVTGGEPLIQIETPSLVRRLVEEGYEVLLETNGSQDVSLIDDRCVKMLDIKCPSSGEHRQSRWENLDRLKAHDEIKFVIGERVDYDYAKRILELYPQLFRRHIVHFSPVSSRLKAKKLAQWLLADHLDVRLHLQLHKIIWGSEEKGV